MGIFFQFVGGSPGGSLARPNGLDESVDWGSLISIVGSDRVGVSGSGGELALIASVAIIPTDTL
jgi:hypothetical protein